MKNFYTYCIYGMNNGNFSFPIPYSLFICSSFSGLCEFSLKKSIVLTIWLYLQVEQRTFREIDKNKDNINLVLILNKLWQTKKKNSSQTFLLSPPNNGWRRLQPI